jgi:hypothetical protein
MQILTVVAAGKDYEHHWPGGNETYAAWIDYEAIAEDGPHTVRIGFGTRPVYERERVRIIVFIDGHPHAEFFGADDFEKSGDVLSEIRIHGTTGEPMCRYLEDAIPERYTTLNVVGMPTRVKAKGVHNAWAVVASIADHRTMIGLAALRRLERKA